MEKKYPHPRDFYVGLLKRNRHVHINGVTYKRVEDLPADLVNETPELSPPVRLRPPPPPPPREPAIETIIDPPKIIHPNLSQPRPALQPAPKTPALAPKKSK